MQAKVLMLQQAVTWKLQLVAGRHVMLATHAAVQERCRDTAQSPPAWQHAPVGQGLTAQVVPKPCQTPTIAEAQEPVPEGGVRVQAKVVESQQAPRQAPVVQDVPPPMKVEVASMVEQLAGAVSRHEPLLLQHAPEVVKSEMETWYQPEEETPDSRIR